MRQPCRAEQGQGCCYTEKCVEFVDLGVRGMLMTAPARFRLGFVVGAGAMFVTGVIVLWYLSGGMG